MNHGHPIRVLHVVGGMNRGGVETWLMHVLRNIGRTQLQMDFLVHTSNPCAYDDEIRALGSRIIPCPSPQRLWQYARNFKRILHEFGPYDVVHSHVHHFSGYVLRIAQQAGVPIRIAHSHNDTLVHEKDANFLRRSYLKFMESFVHKHATCKLSVSRKAALSLFGNGWENDSKHKLFYLGLDFTPFDAYVDKEQLRGTLGLAPAAFVVGHVGRFNEQKNHGFLIDIFAEIHSGEPHARLLLVGDGPLRQDIERKVQELGLAEYVVFAGSRPDVPCLMLGAMDVFVMPSLYEGLGLVGLEAQASGLPCVIAEVIPSEVDVVNELICRLSLRQTAREWAEAVIHLRYIEDRIPQPQALQLVENSGFNINTSRTTLLEYYDA